jgi:hypothetical protein
MNYTAKIDVTKIDKASLYKGKFLDLVLWENRDGPGQYGDTHMIVQSVQRGPSRWEEGCHRRQPAPHGKQGRGEVQACVQARGEHRRHPVLIINPTVKKHHMTANITTEVTTIVDHYASLANSYASKAGQLYGMLEVLPIITQGLSQEELHKSIRTASERAKEIMST